MESLAASVRTALEAADLEQRDAPAGALAMLYAEQIDRWPGSAEALATFGPKLLTTLARLGMTPTSRAAAPAADAPAAAVPAPRPLDDLREQHDELAARRARAGA